MTHPVPTGNPITDTELVDELHRFVNRPGDVNGGDLVDQVCDLLHRSGREVLDNA